MIRNLLLSIGDNFYLENITYEDLLDLAYDLRVKEGFLIKRLKSLLTKIEKTLNNLPQEHIDKNFKAHYIKDMHSKIKKISELL